GSTDLMLSLTKLAIVNGASFGTVEFTLVGSAGTAGTPRFVYVDNPSNPKRIQDGFGNFTVLQTNNAPPTIVLANNNLAVGPSKITLDASASTDPQGQPLTFNWVNTGGPAAITLVNSTTATPFFLGTRPGVYTFQVTVKNALSTATANATVTILNVPPGADAASNQTATPGSLVYLVALATTDANNHALTYTWTQISGAGLGSLVLSPATPGGEVVSFIAPAPATSPSAPNNVLVFEVSVT